MFPNLWENALIPRGQAETTESRRPVRGMGSLSQNVWLLFLVFSTVFVRMSCQNGAIFGSGLEPCEPRLNHVPRNFSPEDYKCQAGSLWCALTICVFQLKMGSTQEHFFQTWPVWPMTQVLPGVIHLAQTSPHQRDRQTSRIYQFSAITVYCDVLCICTHH